MRFACVVAVAALFIAGRAFAADRPNIVFVISDDHRFDMLGAAGNKSVHTPNLDRLAKEGTHFRQATVHVPQCSPCRAMLLTGLPPHQNGHYANQTQRADVKNADGFKQYPMLPALLRDSGYRTVLVGKWHLFAEPWNCGFSDVRVWLPGGGGKFRDEPSVAKGNSRAPVELKGYVNELFGEDAAAFIKSDAAKEKPFFLWVALTAPHTPLTPNPPEVQKTYEGKTAQDVWPPHLPKDAKAKRMKDYAEAVTMADRQLGHVMKALDETTLAANTIVVFMGDNGYMFGSRELNNQKAFHGKVYPYEDSVRVPFVMKAPGAKSPGAASDACVSSLDLPPTLLKYAGVTPPATWAGRDLAPALSGDDKPFASAVCEFADGENAKFGDINYRLIRTKTHKLIDWADGKRADEFYDLKADPQELKNLIDDASTKDLRDGMRKELRAWMEKTQDPALNW
ncbi:MAG: sulfatase-like hydrolase/transferase [Planctomycetota bacterium]|nr:sulfatase-like hydrolase/transferase [Planctomycetota bacterium]